MSCVCLQLFWETTEHFFELTFLLRSCMAKLHIQGKAGWQVLQHKSNLPALQWGHIYLYRHLSSICCFSLGFNYHYLTENTTSHTMLCFTLSTLCCYLTKTFVAFFYLTLCSSSWASLSYKEKLFSMNGNVCQLYSDFWHCGEAEQKILGLCLKSTFCFPITWIKSNQWNMSSVGGFNGIDVIVASGNIRYSRLSFIVDVS